ncbi:MAG: hypothetical protein EOP42_20810 [Sphingobacteriaceae bacterium]|nr:MAG: hypothetical protein EOP42_20810 [Sphingobacteriaceae bacterium]
MRKLVNFSSFCILLTFFISCKKDNYSSKSIIGTWELRQSQGGTIPGTTYNKGNGNMIKFTDSDYEIYANGVLSKSGTYKLIPDTSVQDNVCSVLSSNEYKNRIVFDGKDDARKTFIKISKDELSLVSGCFALDAGSISIYGRP